ncbi:uncharacterized protein Tco025E_09928, partial [Trypanosoma conorhini]
PLHGPRVAFFVGALRLDAAKQSLGVTCAVSRGQMLPECVAGITRLLASACGGRCSSATFFHLPSPARGRILFFPAGPTRLLGQRPAYAGGAATTHAASPRSLRAISPSLLRAPSFSPGPGSGWAPGLLKRQLLTAHGPGAEGPLRYGAPPSRDEQPT